MRIFRFAVGVVVAALLLHFCPSAWGQGVTTATLNGLVLNSSGQPVGGATVTITHVPSGTKTVTVTRSNGAYTMAGLRVGGPYNVSVSGTAATNLARDDVYLSVDQSSEVDFTGPADVVTLEKFTVTSDQDTTFGMGRMSTSTSLDSHEISTIPTVRRDVQDLANIDPRVSLTPNTSTGEFSLSVQGQNSRFNSFLIDGLQSNDPFGLNANGFSSLRSPIPLDAIADFSIDLNPYDVTRSGFTGALVDVVTKSGTNQFHGSLYGYYTGTDLRAANPGKSESDPAKGSRESLRDRTLGGTFGGPIVKDKLFFFIAYEDFKLTAPPLNGQVFDPDPVAVAAITAAAKAYGYDPGTISPGALATSSQKTYLAKIDWNINQQQRATFTYRRVEGSSPTFADYSGSTETSYSNHWYESNRISDNYSLQLNSNWAPNLQTDAGFSLIKYSGTAAPAGAAFPEVYVNGVPGTRLDTEAAVANGQLDLGTNYSYQYNQLQTKDLNGHLYGDYSWGDHTFKVGGDFDHAEYYDAFVQYYYGRYTFPSPTAFAAGAANYLRYEQASPGFTVPDSIANFAMTDLGAVIQDTWKPNASLTITGGLRFDYPYLPSHPIYIPAFQQAFGISNSTTGNGNFVLAPRLGFSYDLPGSTKTEIRGGIGLFQGTNPAVWIANAFDTFGGLNFLTLPAANSVTTSATPLATPISFNPDPHYVQTLPPPGTPQASVDIIDPHFRTPVTWKANLAIDRELPWWHFVVTGEFDATQTESAIYLRSLNINPVGTLPDGRIKYSGTIHPNFSTVFDMGNTNKGHSQAYTVSVHRALIDGWSASGAYTHTFATEVQPLTSSVAASNFNYRSAINPNDNVAQRSAYLVPDKWVFTATKEFHFFKAHNSATRLSAIFRAQTGHAYSWIFYNDVNGDGITGNDSFYVPAGPSDPKVVWTSPAQSDAFFAFVNSSDLKKYEGKIAPGNSSYNPWEKTLDLHLEQDLPIRGNAKVTVYADCLNFANLLNKDWGVVQGLDFGTSYNAYNRAAASATINSAGQYVYSFTSTTLGGQPIFTDLSRWQLQLGVKVQF